MVSYIKGENRCQMSFGYNSLDCMIDENNCVRAIDAIVDMLDKTKLSFIHTKTKDVGRPPHDPVKMFKLYVYSYFEKIRSSRKIEKECTRNIELMWLMEGIVPDHKCICNFRRDNKEAIETAFSEFVEICDALGILGKSMVAIDGSKFRANNARKKNITIKKAKKKIEHFKKMLEEYNNELDKNDEKILNAMRKIDENQSLIGKMESEGINEISLTDPDSRLMGLANSGYEVGFNVQNAVDSENHIIVATDVVTTPADQGQLYTMAEKVTGIFQTTEDEPLTALADKGYFMGADIQKCEDDPKITAIVSRPEEKGNEGYQKSDFQYDVEKDEYTCPAGKKLYRSGQKKRNYKNQRACRACEFKEICTKNARGRLIERGEYEEAIESSVERFTENKELYKQRQMIVEHPFGTVKRTLGFTYFLTRGIENVKTENLLHMLTYNIKRVLNIFSIPDLLRLLKEIRCKRQGESLCFCAFFHVLEALIPRLGRYTARTEILTM